MRMPPTILLEAPPDVKDPAARLWMERAHQINYLLHHWLHNDAWPFLNAMREWFENREQTALTAENGGTVDSGDGTTDDVIEANRTRIGEIEAALEALGLLP
jgi:hypothetical protein